MEKFGVRLALLVLLTGCGAANEAETSTEAEEAFPYQQFFLTRMEPSRSDEPIDYSYEFDLPANAITVKSANSMIGLDGEEITPEPQKLINYERAEDGTLTFSFDESFYTEEKGTYVETKIIILNKLSDSVYALEDGTQFEFSEEEIKF